MTLTNRFPRAITVLLTACGCCLISVNAFGGGGTCPSGANYISPANPTGALVTLSSLGITSCYFFSKSSGLDSNPGTSEGSPQQHLPGMPDYTGSITPAAGEGFILKGGDTWVSADLDLYWQWSGTSSAPIYIGVDPNWYSGTSWARPIFNCSNGNTCSYTSNGDGFYTDQSAIDYITVDDLEMTGLYQSTTGYPNYFSIYGNYNTFERIYLHGWSHAAASTGAQDNSAGFSPSECCGGGVDNVFLFDVVDGSDTTKDMLVAFYSDPAEVGYSVINYVTNGIEGSQNSVHDTLIENIELCFTTSGCHQNAIQQAGTSSGTVGLFYNNVITGVVSGGITKLWLGQAAGGSDLTEYAFNNVIFNNVAGNDVNPCQLNSGSCGTYYYFNNTFECGSSAGVGPCQATSSELAPTQEAFWINNQCIATACVAISGDPNFTYTETDDLVQSVATASSLGYAYNSSYAFQPTESSGGTVGAGANEKSLCSTITSLNSDAGTACQNDTTYACTYNTSNHTVTCPARTPVARPASGAWNIGAYQYGSGVNPPTDLTATPN
jgi:hypothetical protein